MSDVRLTATNPADSSVVPVACNDKGELLVDDSTLDQDYVKVTGANMTGDLTLGTDKITLNATGSATFAGAVTAANATFTDNRSTQGPGWYSLYIQALSNPANPNSALIPKVTVSNDGSATFAGAIESTTATAGVILKSGNGSRYRLTVDDAGNLSTTQI